MRELPRKSIVVRFPGLNRLDVWEFAVIEVNGKYIEFTEDYCFYESSSLEELIEHHLREELKYWEGRLREVLFDVEAALLSPDALVMGDTREYLAESLKALEMFRAGKYEVEITKWEGW